MKKQFIYPLSIIISMFLSMLLMNCSISANSSQSSTASVGFVIAPEDKIVKPININGQTYLRNYQNYTIIVHKSTKDGHESDAVLHNTKYNAVKINFEKSAVYHVTILNGPSND